MIQGTGDRDQTVVVRMIRPSEWKEFRSMRLRVLRLEPGVFASPHDAEANKSRAEWQDVIAGPDHQAFGLFDQERLVGITACFTWREDASQQNELLAMSFIEPAYRGRGLSSLLYEHRLEWIRERPQFRRVVVSHRASNPVSRRANQRHRFIETGRRPRTWPDGCVDDEVFYELPIVRGSSQRSL